jgi:HEAT repeat protein
MKKLFTFSLVACTLVACAKNDSDKKEESVQQAYVEKYSLEMNGCRTGNHRFESTISASDARKKLCVELQNDEANHSCAEELRKEHFNKLCGDMSWQPVYGKDSSGAVTPPTGSEPVQFQSENLLKSRLMQVILESYKLSDSLTAQNKKAATQIAEDMKRCGFGILGIACLHTRQLSAGSKFINLDGKEKLWSEVQVEGIPSKLIFSFDIEIDSNHKYSSNTVRILRALKDRTGDIVIYAKDNSATEFLFEGTLAADIVAAAQKRVPKPADLVELFHMIRILREQGTSSSQNEKLIKDSVEKNRDLIANSNSITYQKEMLSLLLTDLPVNPQVLTEICEKLIQSKSEPIQQVAAIVLLNNQPSRSDMKPFVLKSLNAGNWNIRKKALLALAKAKLTVAEENQILEKIADNDEDVRTTAISIAGNMNLTSDHFMTIKKLSQSTNWSVRSAAVQLLTRLNTAESNQQLIDMLSDPDQDVRAKANAATNGRELNESSVADLSKELKSTSWETRKQAALLLGKIKSKNALQTLISDLDDPDQDVRATILSLLKADPIQDDAVAAVAAKLKSSNWEVRNNAVLLLKSNQSEASTSALIGVLSDPDQEVQTKAFKALDARNLTEKFVEGLKDKLSSQSWEVRKKAASLLGKIKSKAASTALEECLTKEPDQDVQSQIKASIQKIKS